MRQGCFCAPTGHGPQELRKFPPPPSHWLTRRPLPPPPASHQPRNQKRPASAGGETWQRAALRQLEARVCSLLTSLSPVFTHLGQTRLLVGRRVPIQALWGGLQLGMLPGLEGGGLCLGTQWAPNRQLPAGPAHEREGCLVASFLGRCSSCLRQRFWPFDPLSRVGLDSDPPWIMPQAARRWCSESSAAFDFVFLAASSAKSVQVSSCRHIFPPLPPPQKKKDTTRMYAFFVAPGRSSA